METPVLTDKEQFPSEEIIYSHIGRKKDLWCAVFEHIHSKYPDFTEQWNYYNDGKSWLMKVTRKSKTIFWLSLIENTFRITFYLSRKAEGAILNSRVSDELKDQYLSKREINKFPGITIKFKNKSDIEDAKALIAIKLSIK